MIKKIGQSIREYKKPALLSIFFIMVEALMEVSMPFIMAILIDKGIEVGNQEVIIYCSLALLIIAFISLYSGISAGKQAATAGCGFAKNLRQDMYYKIQDFSFKNIDKFSTSSIVTRLTTDVSNVQNAFQM